MSKTNGFSVVPMAAVQLGQTIADSSEKNIEYATTGDLQFVDWVRVATPIEFKKTAKFIAWMENEKTLATFEWPKDTKVLVQN